MASFEADKTVKMRQHSARFGVAAGSVTRGPTLKLIWGGAHAGLNKSCTKLGTRQGEPFFYPALP